MDKKNFLTRLLSALILGPLALFAVYYGGNYMYALVMLISWFSTYELARMFRNQNADPNNLLLYLQVPIIHYYMMKLEFDNAFIFFIVFSVLQYLVELFRNKGTENVNNSMSNFISIYAILFPSMLLSIRELSPDLFGLSYTDASHFIFMILLAIWACDTFAYVGGVNFGKNKLYPRVSPKKSIEGGVFGFVGAMLIVYIFYLTSLSSLPLILILGVGLIVGIFGQIGDLIESLIKRNAGVKDSGDTIPGHGGVLDRIDSIIFVTPIVFLVLYFMNIF